VVVIVTNTILVASRRTGGLNSPDQALLGQHPQGVVHGLSGNGADLSPNFFRDFICRRVGPMRHGPQYA
jgi:hypothetical protein